MKPSVIIIAKNEEQMIEDCLKSVRQLADEIILVDSGSTDKTIEIAKKYSARIISLPTEKLEFAKWRNAGLKAAKGDWVFYLDADERVTPELQKEIEKAIGDTKYVTYAIPRRNYYLGRKMHYGGAWPDYVKRLFFKEKLRYWERELHENPVFDGEMGRLKNPIVHITHRDLSLMVEKTREWSKIEAELLYKTGHPSVTWWRILRIMLSEFWLRGVKLQGWRDGTVGWIEIIFQMFSRFVTYGRLWELQQKHKS